MTDQGTQLALKEISHSIQLWRIWTRLGVQDVRLRFRRSVIGVWWIFLNLGIMILAIGFIYANLLGQDMGTFIPYLTAGLVTWNYITNSIVEGGIAFTSSEGYIKQISLPIYVYTFRYFISIGLTALITLVAYVVVALVYQVPFTLGILWAIPGVSILMLFSLMLIITFAHITARFRDAAHLASVVMQVLFYVTPVLYPAKLLRDRGLDLVVDANPLYHLIQVVRQPLLTGQPADPQNYFIAVLITAFLGAVAFAVIRIYGRRIVVAL